MDLDQFDSDSRLNRILRLSSSIHDTYYKINRPEKYGMPKADTKRKNRAASKRAAASRKRNRK